MRDSAPDSAAGLQPGDGHYRAFVGPPDQYDLMGGTQFALLLALGLRARHRLLDFGCGSLRAGRLLIPYLDRGCYHGLEPNAWLVEDGLRRELGADVAAVKWPHFHAFDDFRAERCGRDFEFILAQSVLSHTGPDLLARVLEGFREALAPDGLAVLTVIHPERTGGAEVLKPGWVYPGCVSYDRIHWLSRVEAAQLHARELPWFHPRQTWWAVSRDPKRLPAHEALVHLGGVLPGVEGWAPDPSAAAGRSGSGPLHLLHISKAGGTAIRAAFAGVDPGRVRLCPHEIALADLPPGERVGFVVRDPVERFVSGFNSRLRQGRPRHFNPWRENEAEIFARWPTANALAEALGAGDADTAQAAGEAVNSIYHTRARLADWLGSIKLLAARADDIVWVGHCPTLDGDFERLRRLVGAPGARLPDDPVEAHRTPEAFDSRLSPAGGAAVRRWYAADYEVYHAALALRARKAASEGQTVSAKDAT